MSYLLRNHGFPGDHNVWAQLLWYFPVAYLYMLLHSSDQTTTKAECILNYWRTKGVANPVVCPLDRISVSALAPNYALAAAILAESHREGEEHRVCFSPSLRSYATTFCKLCVIDGSLFFGSLLQIIRNGRKILGNITTSSEEVARFRSARSVSFFVHHLIGPPVFPDPPKYKDSRDNCNLPQRVQWELEFQGESAGGNNRLASVFAITSRPDPRLYSGCGSDG